LRILWFVRAVYADALCASIAIRNGAGYATSAAAVIMGGGYERG